MYDMHDTNCSLWLFRPRVWAGLLLVPGSGLSQLRADGIFAPALGFRLEAKAGEIARKTAVFDRPGEFEFSCDLPGHREAGMKGMLIVGQGSFPDRRGETNASTP